MMRRRFRSALQNGESAIFTGRNSTYAPEVFDFARNTGSGRAAIAQLAPFVSAKRVDLAVLGQGEAEGLRSFVRAIVLVSRYSENCFYRKPDRSQSLFGHAKPIAPGQIHFTPPEGIPAHPHSPERWEVGVAPFGVVPVLH